jgi:hypothetical protein
MFNFLGVGAIEINIKKKLLLLIITSLSLTLDQGNQLNQLTSIKKIQFSNEFLIWNFRFLSNNH